MATLILLSRNYDSNFVAFLKQGTHNFNETEEVIHSAEKLHMVARFASEIHDYDNYKIHTPKEKQRSSTAHDG